MFWVKLVVVVLITNILVALAKPSIGEAAGDVLQTLAYFGLIIYVWRQVRARRAVRPPP